MTSKDNDSKYIIIFGVAAVLLLFIFWEVITAIILILTVIISFLKYRKTKPTFVGNLILAFITLAFFYLGARISPVWVYAGFYAWVLLLGIIAIIYGIAAIKVSKHFNIPISEKLSNISPSLIVSLEIVFPGIGFTYLGKQKRKNYMIVGLAIFSIYLIIALILTFTKVPDLIIYSYIFIFRLVTPIIAYRTVKKLKSGKY